MSITLKTEELNNICSKILFAVDSNGLSEITETLELVLNNNNLYLQVTNREYFIKIKLSTNIAEDFHATVNAELFLKLISKITTELVTMDISDNCLLITGNGKYKLPLVYDGTELLKLPEITIDNVTNSFSISGDILDSIFTYNSKQLIGKVINNPVQSLYYVDNEGAITFTSGACVNKFELDEDVKLLLNSKLVKLFKLFKSDTVEFSIGQDKLSEELIQTKAKFKTSDIELTAVLPTNEASIKKVPVKVIRDRAYKDYKYSVTINRVEMLQAINRLFIFSDKSSAIDRTYGVFTFEKNKVIISDMNSVNKEEIVYANESIISDEYKAVLDFTDIKSILDSSTGEFITFNFGDNQAIVCVKDNIYNIVPEIV